MPASASSARLLRAALRSVDTCRSSAWPGDDDLSADQQPWRRGRSSAFDNEMAPNSAASRPPATPSAVTQAVLDGRPTGHRPLRPSEGQQPPVGSGEERSVHSRAWNELTFPPLPSPGPNWLAGALAGPGPGDGRRAAPPVRTGLIALTTPMGPAAAAVPQATGAARKNAEALFSRYVDLEHGGSGALVDLYAPGGAHPETGHRPRAAAEDRQPPAPSTRAAAQRPREGQEDRAGSQFLLCRHLTSAKAATGCASRPAALPSWKTSTRPWRSWSVRTHRIVGGSSRSSARSPWSPPRGSLETGSGGGAGRRQRRPPAPSSSWRARSRPRRHRPASRRARRHVVCAFRRGLALGRHGLARRPQPRRASRSDSAAACSTAACRAVACRRSRACCRKTSVALAPRLPWRSRAACSRARASSRADAGCAGGLLPCAKKPRCPPPATASRASAPPRTA